VFRVGIKTLIVHRRRVFWLLGNHLATFRWPLFLGVFSMWLQERNAKNCHFRRV